MALARGTRMPMTASPVLKLSAPTPTMTPAAPVRIRCSAGRVVRRAADDHRHVEVGDEVLEVERRALGGHVLGGDDRALDDQQVDPGGEHRRAPAGGVLRRDAHRRRHPASRISLTRAVIRSA
jgi:hypothetical protein